MSKEAQALEKEIRDESVRQGCKRAGHGEFLLSEDKAIYIVLFTRVTGRENRLETSIGLRYAKLNELSFYISEYGTEYKGRKLICPYSEGVTISNSLHVSGAACFSLFRTGEKHVYGGEGVPVFVTKCIENARRLMQEHSNAQQTLLENLQLSPPVDDQIIINIFVGRLEIARKLVEGCREPDGVFLALVPRQADRYLRDAGV